MHLSGLFATEVASVSNNAQGNFLHTTPKHVVPSQLVLLELPPDGAGGQQEQGAGLENLNVMHKIISMVIIFHTHLLNFYPVSRALKSFKDT